MTKAHKRTDRLLLQKEKKLNEYYDKHKKLVIRLFNLFYKRHEKEFGQKLTQYKNGEITKEEYRQYMLNQTILSSDWQKTLNKLTETISDINQNALHSVTDKYLEQIYLDNYNTTIRAIGDELIENWL